MDFQVIVAIFFVLFLIIFLYIKRKEVVTQKILFPFIYMFLYRTKIGIKLMDKLSCKYKELVKLFGYICIGFGFFGMIFFSFGFIASIYQLISTPKVAEAGAALVLPFTTIPGIGYLSFFHWIIALFVLVIIHEFAHGVVARANDIPIHASGFAFLCVLVPIIPAAFVEPDEKKLVKEKPVVQYSVFAAGPVINILFAFMLLLAFPYVADATKSAPFEDKITEPVGFSFDLTNSTLPAASAGMENGTIVHSFNNNEIKDFNEFFRYMNYCSRPGDTVYFGTDKGNFSVTTANVSGNSVIGISNIQNERRTRPGYENIEGIFYWFKDLIKWLFLLNFFIGLFNLLPLAITDGGRILKTFLESIMKDEKKANKIWGMISLFFVLLIFFSLIVNYFGNPFSLL